MMVIDLGRFAQGLPKGLVDDGQHQAQNDKGAEASDGEEEQPGDADCSWLALECVVERVVGAIRNGVLSKHEQRPAEVVEMLKPVVLHSHCHYSGAYKLRSPRLGCSFWKK